MKSSTKIQRANLVIKILRKRSGKPTSLPTWLRIINSELSERHSLKSTKEVAHMFRYIAKTLKEEGNHCFTLIREKKVGTENRTKIVTTYYTFTKSPDCRCDKNGCTKQDKNTTSELQLW